MKASYCLSLRLIWLGFLISLKGEALTKMLQFLRHSCSIFPKCPREMAFSSSISGGTVMGFLAFFCQTSGSFIYLGPQLLVQYD